MKREEQEQSPKLAVKREKWVGTDSQSRRETRPVGIVSSSQCRWYEFSVGGITVKAAPNAVHPIVHLEDLTLNHTGGE